MIHSAMLVFGYPDKDYILQYVIIKIFKAHMAFLFMEFEEINPL